ncbi:hypothetical protein Trydic_g15429 [Trypoxylus dichotomus]
MNRMHPNKFIHWFRCINFKASPYVYPTRQLQLLQQLRFFRTPSIPYSASDVRSNSLLRLEQHLKFTSKLTTSDIDTLAIDNIDNSKQENRISLLQCCGKLLSNKSLDFRRKLCNIIFEKFDTMNFLGIEEYNTYIKICTENECIIDTTQFLSMMKSKPTEETYKLLLENVCEKGDMNQAYDILSKMKEANFVADERVFNAIIFGHTLTSGLKGAELVLETMKAAHVARSSDTNWHILIGLAAKGDDVEFTKTIDTVSLLLNEEYFIRIIMKLGLSNNEELVKVVKNKLNIEALSRDQLSLVQHVCIQLIHRDKADIAVRIYWNFTQQNVDENHYDFLLEEMLHTNMDPEEIIKICGYIKNQGENLHPLELVTNKALRKQQTERAWYFLKHFDILKPHYFWPLLIDSGSKNGEKGVINTLAKMLEMNVEIDHETLEVYTLPFCDISSPSSFLSRIQHLKIPLKQLITPLFLLLLKDNRVDVVRQLCNEIKLTVDTARLARPLALACLFNKNPEIIVDIMKKIYETNETFNTDFVGDVVVQSLRLLKQKEDYDDFLKFLKILNNEKLTITTSSEETIQQILQTRQRCPKKADIDEQLDSLVDLSMSNKNSYISHPRNMSVDELECHLVELSSKNMETRGVLRRLLQIHGRLGNHSRVQEIKDMLEKTGYEESPGMLAVRLQTLIKTKELQAALKLLQELKEKHPYFDIDDYKVIDLATLLVAEDKFEIAVELLTKEFENKLVRGGLRIERNCINLLHAAKDSKQATTLYRFLIEKNICQPKNVIFGPVLSSYLKSNDIDNAVKYYENICNKYKCTPLQVELLKVLVDTRNEELLNRALYATIGVYGVIKTQMSLAVVFAEKGKKELLTKLLLGVNRVPDAELQNRCNRWVNDGKLESLMTFAEAAARLPSSKLNLSIIYIGIIRLFDNRNDIDGVLKFINKLKEDDIVIPQKVTDLVDNLLKRNRKFPDDKIDLKDVNCNVF